MEIAIDMSPEEIINSSIYNKGTAFTQKERDDLGLNGYLPYHISTIEEQAHRRYENFLQQGNHLSKFQFLSSLQNRNEVLFYKLVSQHISEMLPYIYTPTVGDVSLQYSNLYKEPRGLYLSYPHKDKMPQIIDQYFADQIDVIVVTDGERVLGLGDVGVGGMAIPVGKLSLYTLFGGIHPGRTLPVFLDVGTNNPQLLADPHYVGWRHERITGKEYEDFVDTFVRCIRKKYQNVLLQWEDFAKPNAKPLLDRYREQILSFNDDIQGTAAVVLSAVISSSKISSTPLKKQKIVVLGGGSAGLGISSHIIDAMEEEGMTREEALKCFYIIDINGLIHQGLTTLDHEQKPYARSQNELASWKVDHKDKITLLDVVRNIDATVLIGVSTQSGAFTQEVIEEMAKRCDRPLILPLSNPTSKSEAKPEDVLNWTNGRAIVATGSPFPPVEYNGKIYNIGQCNNVSIFPGLGLGAVACGAKKITDAMFVAAAKELSCHSPIFGNEQASLFPSFENLKEISKKIAFVVAKKALQQGLVDPMSDEEMAGRIDRAIWSPSYPTYIKKRS